MIFKIYLTILLSSISFSLLADDMRTKVDFPPMMRDHMLSNMRDDGGLEKAFSALSEVMKHCVACHNSYKVHD